MTELELVPYGNIDPMKSEVMARAAELRDQGYDKSEALQQAWDDYEEDEEYWDTDIMPQSHKQTRKRKSSSVSNPVETQAGMFLVLGAVCYFLWCVLKWKQAGVWNWKPWQTAPVSPVSRQLKAGSRPQAMPRTYQVSPTIVDRNSRNQLYQANDYTEESIWLITP